MLPFFSSGEIAADLGDLLGGRQRNLVAVEHGGRALAADDPLGIRYGRLRRRCGCEARDRRGIGRSRIRRVRHILDQRRDVGGAEHSLQRLVPADLVAPHGHARRGSADADDANHLLVEDHRQAAGVREHAELNPLQLRIRILTDLVHDGLARPSLHQRRPRLHLRSDDVQVSLAIHAVHVNVIAVVVEHVNADRDVLLDGELLARLGDPLGGCEVDRGEILNLFGGFAADDELRRDVLRRQRRAERDGCRRDSHCGDADVHV